jgi:hyperosmotically inducible periplasmic protein
MKALIRNVAIIAALAAVPVFASNGPETLEKRVRHELLMLPRATVFDNLGFRVDGTTVTLLGQVTQPVLKNDAESAVKHIEGVTEVNNQMEVLPLSPFDWQIRRAEYRAIFGYAPLGRYAMGVIPSIRIVVKNGNVTLMGTVSSDSDRQLAYMRANAVPGVFSVTNQIEIEN